MTSVGAFLLVKYTPLYFTFRPQSPQCFEVAARQQPPNNADCKIDWHFARAFRGKIEVRPTAQAATTEFSERALSIG
jgi:hypothetical protein